MSSPGKRKFCDHCQDYVSLRTYRRHFDLYFNKEKEQWQRNDSSDEESGQISSPGGEYLSDSVHDQTPEHVAVESCDEDSEQESAPGTYVLYSIFLQCLIL